MDVQVVDCTRNLWQLKSRAHSPSPVSYFVDCLKDSNEPCIEERDSISVGLGEG